jgi:branched-chain amino acid transport system ATP-binding protein
MSLLDIRGLHAAYDGADVLHGINLQVEEGSFVAVIGANTAGKSTLLRSISGLVPKVRGEILFKGDNLLKLLAHQIPGRSIAQVPEGRHVFPVMSVEENLLLGGYNQRKDVAGLAQRLQKVFTLFPRLFERKEQLAGTLSGGEQQMVAIGRALMGEPRLLLLDEPSHGLAPKLVQELHDALLAIHKTGVTMLLVEQNTKLALSVASEAFVLQSGKIVLQGKSSQLLNDPRIREAYLGI